MRRGCLVLAGVIVGACLVGWVVLWYAALPRLRGGVQAGLADGIGTEVAARLPATPAGEGGRYVLTEADLESSLSGATAEGGGAGSVEGLDVEISPGGFALGIRTAGGQSATYTGVPAVEAGQLVIREMRSDSEVLQVFLPAEDLAGAIAQGVNGTLTAQGAVLDGLALREGEIELRTAPAGA